MFLVLLVAFVVRVWKLEIKPPHFDEGINGFFVMQTWKEGFYRYDPTNFHGPLYFYVLQMAELFLGRGIFAFRFVNGIIATGIVALVGMHRRFFGQAAMWAAWAIALSPAYVFYSRYAIHESLFVFFQVAFAWGFFRWREERSRAAVAWMTLGFFGTIMIKETFFIFFGTWLIAIGAVAVAERIFPAREARGVFGAQAAGVSPHISASVRATTSDIVAIIGLGVFALIAVYSGFFLHMRGVYDMVAAYAFWTKTGTGATGHEKPFWYFFDLLRTYEWPFLLALVISPLVFFFNGRAERLLTLVGVGSLLAYSLIPYKTPWLILNILWPLGFVLGFGVARVGEIAAVRAHGFLRFALGPVALGTLIVSAATMVRLNFRDYVNPSEPYVYVQSTEQFKKVMDAIEQRRKEHPDDLNMKIWVLNKDPWPMPWMLGDYPRMGFGKAEDANVGDADVILLDATGRASLEQRLKDKYWVLPFKVRDAYEDGFAFFAFERFKGIVPSSSEIFDPTKIAHPPAAPTPLPGAVPSVPPPSGKPRGGKQ
jgi:uncharacterized protein (TIGR03663 family)